MKVVVVGDGMATAHFRNGTLLAPITARPSLAIEDFLPDRFFKERTP